MYPLPGQCPVCGNALEVTRLHCLYCDTALEGHFSLGRLARLSAEQIAFVETFMRCEGTIKRVEKELGISYPTVRTRLREVIRAMGFEVVSDYAEEAANVLSDEERSAILDRLYSGELTSEEALALLRGQA
jgi:hypothetical protein